jgi:glycosyltransferase involved in cell wall biosynthesis
MNWQTFMADTTVQLPEKLSNLRVAIVQHWFVSRGGAERVVESFARIFPQADLVSPIVRKELLPLSVQDRKVQTSFLSKLPRVEKYHRHTLPLQPFALEQLDLCEYDLVLTSDAGPAKGVLTLPRTTHVCYCHSPMRYIWDMYHQYASEMSPVVRAVFSMTAHYLRNFDYRAAARVDHFISNSRFVSQRVQKYYRRESTVINPPVDVQSAEISPDYDDYYLSVGRLVSYKRVDLAVQACTKLKRPLRVIGDGPEYKSLKRIAGPMVEFLGNVSDSEVRANFARCRALLFPCEEDFGIVPVEANAFGRPVIAYGSGGALESVRGLQRRGNARDDATGLFFHEQTAEALADTMVQYERRANEFNPFNIRAHAMKFDTSIFEQRMVDYLYAVLPGERNAREQHEFEVENEKAFAAVSGDLR